ncbi:MAG: hypothetical protein HKN09_13960 [Saprospiraceae bacterium]|nr:hypothetical protein [Saprospiraceae bacterium]
MMRASIYIILGLILCYGCNNNNKHELDIKDLQFTESTTTIKAGEIFKIGINDNNVSKSHLKLLFSGINHTNIINPKPDTDIIEFEVPDSLLMQSGVYVLDLLYKSRVLDTKELVVQPLLAEDIIETYAGPKTILGDGQESSMLVIIPKDKFNNPSFDASETKVLSNNLNASVQSEDFEANKSFLYSKLSSSLAARDILLGSTSGEAIAKEQSIRIIPGSADQIKIFIIDLFPYAHPRRYFKLHSNTLLDSNGNTIPEGSHIYFNVFDESRKLYGLYSSKTVNGVAQCIISNPDEPGKYAISATTNTGVSSATYEVEFQQYVSSIPLAYDSDLRRIKIGPIKVLMGQTIADGTPLMIKLKSTMQEIEFEKVTDNGRVNFILPKFLMISGKTQVQVSCGGLKETVQIEL